MFRCVVPKILVRRIFQSTFHEGSEAMQLKQANQIQMVRGLEEATAAVKQLNQMVTKLQEARADGKSAKEEREIVYSEFIGNNKELDDDKKDEIEEKLQELMGKLESAQNTLEYYHELSVDFDVNFRCGFE
ncbi:uncharacterized protein LOC135842669 [Planococcus citri]|uniref:uncharacterized protein LOC135842669 n=1 Tax=Planococcus citri TaxID=170843 RepID=UPI0031FA4184